jgi:hypothetical protein
MSDFVEVRDAKGEKIGIRTRSAAVGPAFNSI